VQQFSLHSNFWSVNKYTQQNRWMVNKSTSWWVELIIDQSYRNHTLKQFHTCAHLHVCTICTFQQLWLKINHINETVTWISSNALCVVRGKEILFSFFDLHCTTNTNDVDYPYKMLKVELLEISNLTIEQGKLISY